MRHFFWTYGICLIILIGCEPSPYHPRGIGSPTAEEALEQFIRAVVDLDYDSMNQVCYYDQMCGSMESIAMNPTDPDHIQKMLKLHPDTDPEYFTNPNSPLYNGYNFRPRFLELYNQRVLPFRTEFCKFIPEIKKNGRFMKHEKHATLHYPRIVYDKSSGEVIGFSAHSENKIDFIQIKKRWYVYNFNCHSMGRSLSL